MSIKLETNDGIIFDVNLDVAKQCKALEDMTELCSAADDEPLLLTEVNEATLEKVIEWCTHEQNKPEEERFHDQVEYEKEMDRWTRRYFLAEIEMLISLLKASNYLSIKSLIGWSSYYISIYLADKTPEQIRMTFNIENDLAEEDLIEMMDSDESIEELKEQNCSLGFDEYV